MKLKNATAAITTAKSEMKIVICWENFLGGIFLTIPLLRNTHHYYCHEIMNMKLVNPSVNLVNFK